MHCRNELKALFHLKVRAIVHNISLWMVKAGTILASNSPNRNIKGAKSTESRKTGGIGRRWRSAFVANI